MLVSIIQNKIIVLILVTSYSLQITKAQREAVRRLKFYRWAGQRIIKLTRPNTKFQ